MISWLSSFKVSHKGLEIMLFCELGHRHPTRGHEGLTSYIT